METKSLKITSFSTCEIFSLGDLIMDKITSLEKEPWLFDLHDIPINQSFKNINSTNEKREKYFNNTKLRNFYSFRKFWCPI